MAAPATAMQEVIERQDGDDPQFVPVSKEMVEAWKNLPGVRKMRKRMAPGDADLFEIFEAVRK